MDRMNDCAIVGAGQAIVGAGQATGLNSEESNLLTKLINIYQDRLTNNARRASYYQDKHKVRNLGVEIPKDYKNLNLATGWGAKAVDVLAQRSKFDGFTVNGQEYESLEQVMRANDFALSYQMALPSELIYGCGFWTATNSDNGIVVRYFDATRAAAVWDYDKRNIKYGFVITDFYTTNNGDNIPKTLELYTDNACIEIELVKMVQWEVIQRVNHTIGCPLMVSMAYRPTDDLPFGKSRISKAVMSIVDDMQREIMRTEMHSDVFSVPHRYLLGANEAMFDEDKRKMYYTNMLIAERDENGDLPQYGQLNAASMQPHLDVMRNLASRLAAECSFPVNELGIIHDNPSSAEALKAAGESLRNEADALNMSNGRTLRQLAKIVLALLGNKQVSDLSEEERSVTVNWKDPFQASIAAMTDAMLKQVSIAPYLTGDRDFWVQGGFTDEQAKRFVALDRKYRAEQRIAQQQFIPKEEPKEEKVEEENDNDTSPSGNELS